MVLDAQTWHIIGIIVFPVVSTVGIIVAIFLSSSKKLSSYSSYGNVFSAGVLLSGGIVHGLGEATELMEESGKEGREPPDFPLTYTIFGGTIVFLVCIEAIVNWAIDYMLKSGKFSPKDAKHGYVDEESQEQTAKNADNQEQDEENPDTFEADGAQSASTSSRCPNSTHAPKSTGHSHSAHQGFKNWVSVLLTIVLSIHVLIEGVSFGAASEVSLITSLFTVICIHKLFASFALGSTMVAGGLWSRPKEDGGRVMFYVLSGIFLVMTILGVGIGMAITNVVQGFAVAILTSMTGGSFLFVALCEVLPAELEKTRVNRNNTLGIVISLCLGYVAMTLLVLAEPPEEE